MALCLVLGAIGAGAPPAAARMALLYDHTGPLRSLTAQEAAGLGPADGAVQVQPGLRVLPGDRQAWKVSSRPPTASTPSVEGRDAESLAALLEDRIRRAGGHLVVLDELDRRFAGAGGDALAGAMARLASRPSPWGEPTLARHVHVFVRDPRSLFADPEGWAPAWSAILASGGAWLEAYGTQPWAPEQWLAWPGAFLEQWTLRGGDPERLHLVLTRGDQAGQWAQARTGAACLLLANGPGAYRVEDEAPAFLAEYRATFGPEPAGSGRAPLACAPTPVLPPERAAGFAGLMLLAATGAALDPRALPTTEVPVGRRSRLPISLGADPLGLAARIGADPAAFWARAGAVLRAEGAGARASARVRPDGTVLLTITPTTTGPIALRLTLSGAAIREAIGTPVDLRAALPADDPRLATARRALRVAPLSWTLSLPVGPAADPLAPAMASVVPPPPPPPPRPARIRLGLAGPASVARAGLDRRRWRLAAGRVLTASGAPLAGARVVVRLPTGRGRVMRTDRKGGIRIAVPVRARGVLRAAAARGVSAALRMPVAKPRRR
jgi:hypothetical protein